jgi:hypothetical protein
MCAFAGVRELEHVAVGPDTNLYAGLRVDFDHGNAECRLISLLDDSSTPGKYKNQYRGKQASHAGASGQQVPNRYSNEPALQRRRQAQDP